MSRTPSLWCRACTADGLQRRIALFVVGLIAAGCGQNRLPTKPIGSTTPAAVTASELPVVTQPESEAAKVEPRSETEFLKDDAKGLIVARPQRIAESELYRALKGLGLLKGVENVVGCGLNPKLIERAIIVLDRSDLDFAEASLMRSRASSDEMTEKVVLEALRDAFAKLVEQRLPYPRANGDAEGKQTGLSWRVHLLPALGYSDLYEKFHLDEPWDSKHNKTLINKMPLEFTSVGVRDGGKTSIHVFVGKDTPFSGDVGPRYKDFKDDPSKTILVIAAGKSTAEIWTKPGGIEFDPESPKKSIGDVHSTFRVLSAEGDVLTLSRNIDDRTLANMIQWNDGNMVGPVDASQTASSPHAPTVILKLASKIDPQSFLTKFQGGTFQEKQEESYEGQALRVSEGSACSLIDDIIVLTGPVDSVKEMIRTAKSGRKEPSPLLSNLKSDADLTMWLDLRKEAAESPSPKDASPVQLMANKVTSISLQLNLTGDPATDFLAADLSTINESVAKRIKKEITKSVSVLMGRSGIGMYFEEDVASSMSSILKSLSIEQTEDRVALKIPGTEDVKRHRAVIETGLNQQARETAELRILQKIRALGLVMQGYVANHEKFPGAGRTGGSGTGLSWRVHLLPLMGHSSLYKQFNLDEPWDSPNNKLLIEKMPEEFRTDDAVEKGKTSFHVFTGPGAPFEKGEPVDVESITDGPASTILIVQGGADTADVWTKPGGLNFDPKNPVGSLGDTGDTFAIVLMDGSARRIPRMINSDLLRRLIQHQDAEIIDGF